MIKGAAPRLEERTVDELVVDDEASFRHVGLYADLKQVLRSARYPFRVLPASHAGRWDRALLLNLTFWGASDGGDVLVDEQLPADVVAHAAWHHLAARALATGPGEAPSADALFLGEAIASAFDVYLVGRLLGHAPRSSFLETQVPAMADAAEAAGMAEAEFDALLEQVAADPERAFEELRALLFDASRALFACRGAGDALAALAPLDARRFGALLPRYELSNWVLYARAYAAPGDGGPSGERARELDRTLRSAPVSLDWLASAWVRPAADGATPTPGAGSG